MRLVERLSNRSGGCKKESGQKVKFVFYFIPFGSILITIWISNFQNGDLMENSYFITDMNEEYIC